MGFKRWVKSLGYAWQGIVYALKTQKNLQFHGCITLVVFVFGWGLKISSGQWIAVVFAIGFVWAAELLNTAIECTVDLITREFHPLAEIAKNVAAAAVLIAAINALIVGLIVFSPALYGLISTWLSR